MKIEDLVSKIFSNHQDELKQCIVDDLLEESIDIVLECIYSDINDGKIRVEGVLDKIKIYNQVLEYMKIKRSKNEQSTK